jgi:hypothetical protein
VDTPLGLVTDETPDMKPKEKDGTCRELPVTEDVLFRGTDERGHSGWFIRLIVDGLFPRRVGPYRTKSEASDVLEEFMTNVQFELFMNLMNEMEGQQVIVVEGIPTLKGR